MTSGTPRIYNTKYVLYKGELNQEEILLLVAYAEALRNKDGRARELRDKALRIVDRIRPKHIHEDGEVPLRVRGYDMLREHIKIRFTCSHCGRSVYLRIPIPKRLENKKDASESPTLRIDSVVYVDHTDYEIIRKHVLSLQQKSVDLELRRRALAIIDRVRPSITVDGECYVMAISNYKLYSGAIAIKFRSKRLGVTKTLYLKPLPSSPKSLGDEAKQISVLTELYKVLKTHLIEKRKKKEINRELKQKLRELIEQIRPTHQHGNAEIKLHIHEYYKTKSGDITIRFRCPKCGKTESIRLPSDKKGKAQLKLKAKFVFALKKVRCVYCGSPVARNGSAKTKVENLRIQQYKCTNPHCQKQFRATSALKAHASKLLSLLTGRCEVCGSELRVYLRERKMVSKCKKCGFERVTRRRIPVLRVFPDDSKNKLLMFTLVDAIALIFAEWSGLPFEYVESIGYAARKHISELSYSKYSALLHSPMPFVIIPDAPNPTTLFRTINSLNPEIARNLVNFSARLAYSLLRKASNLSEDLMSALYVVDSTVQMIVGPYVPDDSNLRFHLAVSLPFLIIDDVIFGEAEHEFRFCGDVIGEIGDREYAVRGYAGEALRSGISTVIMPRGDASKFDLLVVNRYLFELFDAFYYFRWVVEPVIGFISGYSNRADSRLFKSAMVEVCIRGFVWNVLLIGRILSFLSRRLKRGVFDVLFDFWDGSVHLFKSAIKLYKMSYKSSCLEVKSCVFRRGIGHPNIVAS